MKIQLTAICISLAILAGCSKKTGNPADAAPASAKVESAAQTPAQAPAQTAPSQAKTTEPSKSAANPVEQKAAVEDKSKPMLDYAPKPIYPSSLLDLNIEGEAHVQMRVTPEGKPADIEIVEVTDPGFGKVLLNVLPLWRFIPAEMDGVPVARTITIAIPFVINNRSTDLPESIYHGQAELIGFMRPAHPGKGKAKAIVRFTLSSDTIVSGVEIVQKEGYVDEKALINTLSDWVFMPSKYTNETKLTTTVEAEIIFTDSNNVLIQYPYPAPKPTN